MRHFFLLLAVFTAAQTHALYSEKGNTAVMSQASLTDYQPNFLLPLDVTKEPRSTFSVTIPKDFIALQPLEQFGNAKETMIEYIPRNEKPDAWSEIITVNKFIGQKIQAGRFADVIKQTLTNTTQSKLLSTNTSKRQPIEQSRFIMHYTDQGKQEVLGALYYSGPYDLAGVQYTIRLKGGQTVADAVLKIESFFENNTRVITSN